MERQGIILVYAPNQAGEQFVRTLREGNQAFGVVVNLRTEHCDFEKWELKSIVHLSGKEKILCDFPEIAIRKVYIFEQDFFQALAVLETIRKCTSEAIYVITPNHYPQMIYKALGADYVIRTVSSDLSFLVDRDAR